MGTIANEPNVSVGLMESVETVRFQLKGDYRDERGKVWPAGRFTARVDNNSIMVVDSAGASVDRAPSLRLSPLQSPSSSFVVQGIVIGLSFHWEQKQDQEFNGSLRLQPSGEARLCAINEVPLETYLTSVISSEMSGGSDPELLKAHAIISRGWLLAQLSPWKEERVKPARAAPRSPGPADQQIIRWYDRENHHAFDVCADDHCQRYQGITRSTSPQVAAAVRATCGEVLTYDGALCDARFSKSCGGMTEGFSAAWEDLDYAYLAVSYDGELFPGEFALPLTEEEKAAAWIRGRPPAFCNTDDRDVLRKILPDFDQETTDYYRWRVTLTQGEVQQLLREKLGIELGAIVRMEPLERGGSGRIVRLRLVGEQQSLVIGKELEIRRALSPSHLYSSAFVVEPGPTRNGIPADFTLIGAGWGHGVGLCQIGAAMMAERGYNSRQILAHYYRGAEMIKLYD